MLAVSKTFRRPAVPQTLKSALRSAAGRVYVTTQHLMRRLGGTALVLMYHRVIPRSEVEARFVQPGMYVTPETFERHLRFLTAHFEVVALQELLTRWQSGIWNASARYCCITFDDGWVDNYRYAFPLLRAHDVPATVFLTTDLIGTDEWLWCDRLGDLLHRCGSKIDIDLVIEWAKTWSAEEREGLIGGLAAAVRGPLPPERRFLNWDEVREMSRHRIDFGSHTSTHAILTRLDAAALERELRRPIEALASHCDAPLPVLAYPNGDHSDVVAAAARMAGYRAAVTTRPGVEPSRPEDLFRLKRIGVHEDVTRTIPLFMFHMARQISAA